MKRHQALHPLSRDHHHVLVHARRLRGLDARIDAATARGRFLSYSPVLLLHFEEEERVLAPKIADPSLRQRLLDEHAGIRRSVLALAADAGAPGQAALGEALRQHVRFEEDLLYPHLESTLAPEQLVAAARDGAAFRAGHRPGSLDGDEACFL